MTEKALITGITGQDGSHLAELLLGVMYGDKDTDRQAAQAVGIAFVMVGE